MIVYPTATVYGIGGDARDADVSRRVARVKNSSPDKPHLIITDEWSRVRDWVVAPTAILSRLMNLGEDLPITILIDAGEDAPSHLVGAGGKIGIRRTSHDFCRELIRTSGCSLISTSANITGQDAPRAFEEIASDILDETDLAVKGAPGSGLASTLVSVENGGVEIIREGVVEASDIYSRITQI